MYKSILVILFLGAIANIQAQSNPYSNIKTYKLTVPINPIIKTNNSIIPSSIQFKVNKEKRNIDYTLDNNKITIDTSKMQLAIGDTMDLFLRVFPMNFMAPYFNIDANKVNIEDIAIPIEADFNFGYRERKNLFSKGLNYNGSFSRGLSVGNSQSLVLNSQLNLQLDGDLGNGLSISAAISDDQIPIQPEGNTQILQEFDKVFIKITKNKTSLVAGDYDLKSIPLKFAKYKKKMKGIKLQNTLSKVGNAEISTIGSFAISKGKFIREKIKTSEGNQGPYRLNANGSSNYLIIIAGSEKVFLDGKLLKRGESLDYTIDYNRAEVFFTAKNIITAEKRIVIEYEYRDQSYLRSMYAIQNQIKKGNATFSIDFFREADSKSIASNEDIDSLDLIILQEAGDNTRKSIRTGIFPIQNIDDSHTEYYNKEKSDNPDTDSILVYTAIPDIHSYMAFFSNVGSGNGSYIIDSDAKANGRVYKYVGFGQGTYEPIKQLIAPQKKQMLSLGAKFNLKSNTKVTTEISLSDFDNNRFSPIDNHDNKGLAGYISLEKTTYFDTSHNWKLQTDFASEYIHENFNSINPYRNVEYSRDWNLQNASTKTQELLNKAKILLKHKQDYQLSYGIKSFVRKDIYNGLNHEWDIIINKEKYGILINGSFLKANEDGTTTNFLRPNIDTYINITPKWKLGTTYNHEQLRIIEKDINLLSPISKSFSKYGVYLNSISIDKLSLQLSLNRRTDKNVNNGLLNNAYQADELNLNGKWTQKNSQLNWDIGFRNLKVINPDLTNKTSGSNLLTNISYSFTKLNKAIRSNTNYQIGVGQEPKLEYSYEKVQAGEGNYVWLDYNEDEIEQIDEFINAIIQDTANYIKIPVFNNQFISTNTMELSQNLRLEPSLYLKSTKKHKWLKKWSSHSTFRVRQKQVTGEDNSAIPLFHFNLNDSLVFSHSSIINNTIFFNKGNPKYDFQIGNSDRASKITQVTGYEIIKNTSYFIRARVNIKNTVDLINKYTYGNRNRNSEKFETRAYNILSHLITSTISYRPKNNLRINITAEYDIRNNQIINQETTAKSKKLNLNTNYKINKKSSIITDLKYVNVSYDGESNTPLHTIMLDGLRKGNNYIWSAFYNRELRKNLYLSIRYSGIKTGEVKTIHSGTAQIKASF